MGAAVTLDKVHFGFGDSSDVLKGLSLEIQEGESFVILGTSGSGKSTLLKVAAGLWEPRGGSRGLQGKVGFAFQRNGLFDSLSVAENLRLPLKEGTELSEREMGGEIHRALKEVGLEGQGARFIHELSGGMQKRVGVARAMILSPQVVFFDEPTAGLDPLTGRTICELIRDFIGEKGITSVVATSDPVQASILGRRVGFLHEGVIQAAGTLEELRRSRNPAVHQFLRGLATGPLTEGH